MKTEFSRRLAVGRIGAAGREMEIEADAAERAALARRFGLPAIHALSCRYRLTLGRRDEVLAEGWMTAEVEQECVLTAEPFVSVLTAEIVARLVPAERFREDEELDPEAVDEIPYENDTIDLGELTAEELSLALDLYPRRPGAMLPDEIGHVDVPPTNPEGAEDAEEGRPSPFAGLAALRKDDT
ncbi:DUF177 domain-containing protein [Gluconacetobacter liquefaciens]|uniref:DUF177 domain-containing protein n=1 Tax=Gluconacetobacter liquefaciens TaxID=89584 RepID=A0A370FXE9_GLULI|nr:DUF177 domain-containing protein [Gluconacetobacter liquefaciens]MBB2188191.1 DUF177 domain-containing protein [Gluconacetobacter liquefaciens]RDI34167.1 uncharacterized protein DUF177 involved in 23S rRNA accumulation [Gluconacetobacter liquefaciens]